MGYLLKIKNGAPPQRKSGLRKVGVFELRQVVCAPVLRQVKTLVALLIYILYTIN